MSDPHLSCRQLETRLRDKIDQLKDHNKGLENALENVHYELEEAQDQIARSGLNEETETEEHYRIAHEELNDEITAAERKATTDKMFTKTAEHSEEWHAAYIAGLRYAAKLLTR